jgi:hypothetical protein
LRRHPQSTALWNRGDGIEATADETSRTREAVREPAQCCAIRIVQLPCILITPRPRWYQGKPPIFWRHILGFECVLP